MKLCPSAPSLPLSGPPNEVSVVSAVDDPDYKTITKVALAPRPPRRFPNERMYRTEVEQQNREGQNERPTDRSTDRAGMGTAAPPVAWDRETTPSATMI